MRRRRCCLALASSLGLAFSATAQDLPRPSAPGRMDFEPELTLTGPPAATEPEAAASGDVAKIERSLERAKRTAASFERLFKEGAGARVEVERSALKVLLLSKQLAEARLGSARAALAAFPAAAAAEDRAAAEKAVQTAAEQAQQQTAIYQKAQLDEAALNLQRWQKLLAFGAARKSDVARAKEQLELLQHPPPAAEGAPPRP